MSPISNIEEEVERHLPFLFRISMWWRIFYGFLRIFLGTTLLKITGQPLSEIMYSLMSHEVTGHTSDFVLEKLYLFTETHEITVTYFIAFYFLFWGTVDIILSFCLLKHIKQAFPIAMGIIVLFILYGLFRLSYTHSGILACVIILDLVILYLINDEYHALFHRTTSKISRPSDLPLHQS